MFADTVITAADVTAMAFAKIRQFLVRIPLRPLGNFGNFLYPIMQVSFGRDTKRRRSFYLVSVYPTQGLNV